MIKYILILLTYIGLINHTYANEGKYLKVNNVCNWNNQIIATCAHTQSLVTYSLDGCKANNTIELNRTPTGIAIYKDIAYVTTFDMVGELLAIDLKSGKIIKKITVGSGACAPIINKQQERLYICNRYSTDIVEISLKSFKVLRSVKALREPCAAVFDKDNNKLYVANFLPLDDANNENIGGKVTVINTETFMVDREILLATGSNALRGIALSQDNEFLFVTHNLGRFQLPTTQLQQGWMNTSAMSVVSVKDQKYLASVLLDQPDRGAAGIWDVKCGNDKIAISHAGVDEISIVDYTKFKERFQNYPHKQSLSYDLRFMDGIRERVAIKGKGVRSINIVDDKVVIPTYFSDTLNILSFNEAKVLKFYPMLADRVEDDVLMGESYFNDATFCFQNWQSCDGCHPGDARTDGLNWDLLNDGIGNPKNTKSMLFAHKTPPAMISGIRESSYMAVRTGFKHIQFHEIPEDIADKVDKYLLSLSAVPSPYLINGKLSATAKRGKKLFEKYSCDFCHSGEYYTNMQMHRIGNDVEFEKGWDTPTLREVWRTAPYLFDGRAATMKEVYFIHKHGIKGEISEKESEELAEYVLSL